MHRNLQTRLFSVAWVVVVLLAAGCASSRRFRVDAIKSAEPAEEPVAYVIASGHPDLGSGDLAFDAVAHGVRTALSSKGWYEAADLAHAGQIVEIDFGCQGPVRHLVVYTSNMPAPFSAPGIPLRLNAADPTHPGIGNGMINHVNVYKEYDKFLRITAREAHAADGRPARQLWSVFVQRRDGVGKLDGYVSMLVAAAMDYVDENLPEPIDVDLRPDDDRVAFVEAGL